MSCPRQLRAAASCASLLLAGTALCSAPTGRARADDWVLDALHGEVEIARGGLPIWETARPGQTLTAGDALRSQDSARVELRVTGAQLQLVGQLQLRLESATAPDSLEIAHLSSGRCSAAVSRDVEASVFRIRAAAVEIEARDAELEISTGTEGSRVRVARGRVRVAGTSAGAPHAIELLAGFATAWPGVAPFEIGLAHASPDVPAAPAAAESQSGGRPAPVLRATLIPGQAGAGEISVEGADGALQTLSLSEILGVLRGEPGLLHPHLEALLEASQIAPDQFAAQLAAML